MSILLRTPLNYYKDFLKYDLYYAQMLISCQMIPKLCNNDWKFGILL